MTQLEQLQLSTHNSRIWWGNGFVGRIVACGRVAPDTYSLATGVIIESAERDVCIPRKSTGCIGNLKNVLSIRP